VLGADKTQPPTFGDLSSNKHYIPSAVYIMSLFKAYTADEVAYMKAYMTALGGSILKLDHSFKMHKVRRPATAWWGLAPCPPTRHVPCNRA
jgi:hypothetical protein